MDSLEKLFLSCLVLFGMFIMFLFGLYFDLGDMLASTFHRDERNATGVGITDNLIQQMEAHARPREIMPTSLHLPTFSSMDETRGAEEMAKAAMRYAGGRGVNPMSGKVLAQLKRGQLIAAGVQREEVLEMETLGADRDESSRILKEAIRLAGEKKFLEGAKIVSEAIQATNPKNLLVLRDYHDLHVQLYLDAKQIDKARESARKLYDILDRIIIIKTLEGTSPKLEAEITLIRAQKERLDTLYAELQKRTEETGSPTGLTAAEKTQMKDAFDKARREGKMSEEEYQRAVKVLET